MTGEVHFLYRPVSRRHLNVAPVLGFALNVKVAVVDATVPDGPFLIFVSGAPAASADGATPITDVASRASTASIFVTTRGT